MDKAKNIDNVDPSLMSGSIFDGILYEFDGIFHSHLNIIGSTMLVCAS